MCHQQISPLHLTTHSDPLNLSQVKGQTTLSESLNNRVMCLSVKDELTRPHSLQFTPVFQALLSNLSVHFINSLYGQTQNY